MVARLIFSENVDFFPVMFAGRPGVVQVFNIGASKAMTEQAGLNEDRRAYQRRPPTASYRIAEFRDATRPQNLRYRWILCCDISDGGFSYWSLSPPGKVEMVLDLSDGPEAAVYKLAHVKNVRPTGDGRYLVGCQFVRQLS
jgi:hypothetical protein